VADNPVKHTFEYGWIASVPFSALQHPQMYVPSRLKSIYSAAAAVASIKNRWLLPMPVHDLQNAVYKEGM
jgi:hypothetical protein